MKHRAVSQRTWIKALRDGLICMAIFIRVSIVRPCFQSDLRVVAKHLDDDEPEKPRSLSVEHSSHKQPLTDVTFEELRISEEGISSDLDDIDIRVKWQPRVSAQERRRFDIFALTPDLQHCEKSIRKAVARLRFKSNQRLDITDELRRDRRSLAGKKLQAALRAKIAGASMRGVPPGAALWLTIDLAAVTSLPIWLKAGGASPRVLIDNGISKLNDALDEIGSMHILMEGYFEISRAKHVHSLNPLRGQFAKEYASRHWPNSLELDGYGGPVLVPHLHALVALLDRDGKPIDSELFKAALKKRFPVKRSIYIRPVVGDKTSRGLQSLPAAVEAAMRYAAKRNSELDRDEIVEQQRWQEALEPEDVWMSGWRSRNSVKPMSVPIMRASLLARQKLREALVDFEIGRGWMGPQKAVARKSSVISFAEYRDARRTGAPIAGAATSRRHSFSASLPVGARAGPIRKVA
jgi:hypothetical protein